MPKINNDPFATTVKRINDKETVYRYHRRPNETKEQYHDRVIDGSFPKEPNKAGG